MNTNSDAILALLENEGDPFEKVIARSVDSLHPVLYPYALVWGEHIRPRRLRGGAEVDEQWMAFGGSHYTALIRLYHAYRAKQVLLGLCKELGDTRDLVPQVDCYEALLEVHAVCAAFWENVGAAIDNFAHSWDDARRLLVGNAKSRGAQGDEPISGKTISHSKYPSLSKAFARRTQYIHSRLVPKFLEGGKAQFNLRHYDDERTVWLPETTELRVLDVEIEARWSEVLAELGGAWLKLAVWMRSRDMDRPGGTVAGGASDTPISASGRTVIVGATGGAGLGLGHAVSGYRGSSGDQHEP